MLVRFLNNIYNNILYTLPTCKEYTKYLVAIHFVEKSQLLIDIYLCVVSVSLSNCISYEPFGRHESVDRNECGLTFSAYFARC
jgi:hypothetical protein